MVIFNSYVKLPEGIRVQPADFPFLMDNFYGTSSFFMPDYTRDSEGKWRLKNGKSPRITKNHQWGMVGIDPAKMSV